MRVVVVLVVLMFVVLFTAAVIAPRRSRRLEEWMDDRLEHIEDRGDDRAGRLGDWTAKTLNWTRRGNRKVAETGRRTRAALPGASAEQRREAEADKADDAEHHPDERNPGRQLDWERDGEALVAVSEDDDGPGTRTGRRTGA